MFAANAAPTFSGEDLTVWCVYTLADPRTSAVRYVGQTLGAAGRLDGHSSEARARSARVTPKVAWLRELNALGLGPIVAVVDTYRDERSAAGRQAVERQWIDAFVEAGADLVNVHGNPVRERPMRRAAQEKKRATLRQRRAAVEARIAARP